MPFHARLMLLSDNSQWLESYNTEFDRLGMKSLMAPDLEAAQVVIEDMEIEAVLIDPSFLENHPNTPFHLDTWAKPRVLVQAVIGDEIPENTEIDLLKFDAETHVQQIILTFERILRNHLANEEYFLRKQTFEGHSLDENLINLDETPLSILSVGPATPEFLALNHALQSANVNLMAALSSYSAFDYLHEHSFDGVVLWAQSQPSECLSIASGMRRNARLYHTPVILRLEKPLEMDLGEPYLRGVNEIATAKASTEQLCKRIIRLAKDFRHQKTMRQHIESFKKMPKIDKSTGLFSKDLFASHLLRLKSHCQDRNRPLSLCVLRVAETPEVHSARKKNQLKQALTQVGSMIARLIRAEDTGARLSDEVFALALPATTEAFARQVGERIAAVVACTAFDSGMGKPPFVVELDMGAAQIKWDESPAEALLRAASLSRENL